MKLKIKVGNREYNEYGLFEYPSLKEIAVVGDGKGDSIYDKINPAKLRLFDQDIFEYKGGGEVEIIHSTARNSKYISGVLILQNNRAYGKASKHASCKKFLYKCIPDDCRLPAFLIGYKPKLTFDKNLINKYVVFKFANWDDIHPRGTIVQIIGDITVLSNFYEYQLYCKSLHTSIQQFTKDALKTLRDKDQEKYVNEMILKYGLQDRRSHDVFTIDSRGSKSFDDACEIRRVSVSGKKKYVISIYISNVSMWMDTLNLWGSFSDRIATIYLPDKKRPMLPTVLSDNLCSLKEGQGCPVHALDIWLNEGYEIEKHEFKNAIISVKRNFAHRDFEDTTATTTATSTWKCSDSRFTETFNLLMKITRKLNIESEYKISESIQNTHDFISYWMIFMNHMVGKKLTKQTRGICRYFKGEVLDGGKEKNDFPPEVNKFIRLWNSNGCEYRMIDDEMALEELNRVSGCMNQGVYVNITSPIRRLVDLLNQIQMMSCVGVGGDSAIKLSKNCEAFYERWTTPTKIAYLNNTMKAIRRVQRNCALLDMCVNNCEIMDKIYVGYIFNRMVRTDGLFQYLIYLPEIKMMNRLATNVALENMTSHNFKLYIFENEAKFKRKIKLELVK